MGVRIESIVAAAALCIGIISSLLKPIPAPMRAKSTHPRLSFATIHLVEADQTGMLSDATVASGFEQNDTLVLKKLHYKLRDHGSMIAEKAIVYQHYIRMESNVTLYHNIPPSRISAPHGTYDTRTQKLVLAGGFRMQWAQHTLIGDTMIYTHAPRKIYATRVHARFVLDEDPQQ